MKRKWEYRYLHEKAVRDAFFKMAGKEIPKDEPYGVLKYTNDKILQFDGKVFFPILEKSGHTRSEFEECKCYMEYRNAKD